MGRPGVVRVATCVIASVLALLPHAPSSAAGREDLGISILVYHRFGAVVSDTMTVRTSTFRWQLQYLKDHHYPIVPLGDLVAHLRHGAPRPPAGSVIITADDGHRSIMTDMLPLVREYGPPITLFIYPSAISNASYALTWTELAALRDTGRFDVQSHTFWHPNFAVERRRLTPAAFASFARQQLCRSRDAIAEKLGTRPDLVAWPFGIYDPEVGVLARECGYIAGFTLDRRTVRSDDDVMALPRFLVTDAAVGRAFTTLLPGGLE